MLTAVQVGVILPHHLTSVRNNQLQLGCNIVSPVADIWFVSRFLMNLPYANMTPGLHSRKPTHVLFSQESDLRLYYNHLNHIQSPLCNFTVQTRWNSIHKTGIMNKWLQLVWFINSRGTCIRQAVRSKWKPLACSLPTAFEYLWHGGPAGVQSAAILFITSTMGPAKRGSDRGGGAYRCWL